MGSLGGQKGTRLTLGAIALALFGLLLTIPFEAVTGWSLSGVDVAVYKWLLAAGLCLFVVGIEKRSLSSIGFRRPDRWDLAITVGLWLAIMLSVGVMQSLLAQFGLLETANGSGTPPDGSELYWSLFIAATAGVTEEVLYRGYALERLESITASTWVAGIVTATVFVLIHVGDGIVGMLVFVPAAILLTVAYVWRRTLFVVVGAHVAVNTVPLVLLALSA
ncbi:hypothetical protein C483_05478 [Natrialba hulunbeirensis JCM 10989]|uniref:CAAX prenyl protease 2/Lysostaphin resistance protein A-like domain-containing protein n=1 Tax=Natrialba hulunbeirensis JCM 10989 TaxID=1227493 RepID=M0A4X9_9EURY|nr:type II CAAX endopeptidase family protein [Natrialba hulunbeirensis]ELY93391.1 hypothetical protein C483_05478 [Natrialba hulunbeirensis JCM 10989]